MASQPSGSLAIEEILQRIRKEIESRTPEGVSRPETGPRRQEIKIPLVPQPDDGDSIPTGRPFYSIEDFLALDEEAFLQNAYRVILGREIDTTGRSHFLPALREGRTTMVSILSALSRSQEGRARGVQIRRLTLSAILDRLAQMPVLGKVLAPFMLFATLPRSLRRYDRRLAAADLRHRQLIAAINTALLSTRKSIRTNEQELRASEQQIETIRQLAQAAVDGSEGARIELAATRQLIAEESRQLGRLIAAASEALPEQGAMRETVTDLQDHALDSLYVAFENRFRGSTAEIGKRTERYLTVFKQTEPVAAGGVVLDIGCGRGEWLSLLGKHNIATRGLDLNTAMVAEARSLGLDVIEGDAIAYLRSLPENSLAAVTGFHIVEHLDFRDLVALFDEAHRVLAPAGILLFETPNPENLVVGACTFNYDPTHKKPLPPDLLHFLAESRGYEAARIIRSDDDCRLDQPASGFTPTEINDWFRQPPDYAVYAQKPRLAGQA